MAKYFLDFEFIEGFHKPLFGKRRHFIDMISVGIVREDGATYYAISNEFKAKDASQWVKDNVISNLGPRYRIEDNGSLEAHLDKIDTWKSNKEIANDIFLFCMEPQIGRQEFYGYYADYDWVLFCSLFGTMMDLPKGYPMYCRDLKQMIDAKISDSEIRTIGYEAAVERIKKKKGYPVQKDEHHALADADWNLALYKFLKTF